MESFDKATCILFCTIIICAFLGFLVSNIHEETMAKNGMEQFVDNTMGSKNIIWRKAK